MPKVVTAHGYGAFVERYKECAGRNNLRVVNSRSRFTYFLSQFCRLDKAGTRFLMVVGPGGTGKSAFLKKFAAEHPDKVAYTDNAASAPGLYRWAYENKDKILIIDDVDGLLCDPDAVSLLKSLTDTRDIRTVSWQKENSQFESLGIKKQFTTTSRVCIVTNKFPNMSDTVRGHAVQALMTRPHDFVVYEPLASEIHDSALEWIPAEHKDVHAHIEKQLDRISQLNYRWYATAIESKVQGRDWRAELEDAINDGDGQDPGLVAMAQVQTIKGEKAQLEAWCQKTGLGRSSFFVYKKSFKRSTSRNDA